MEIPKSYCCFSFSVSKLAFNRVFENKPMLRDVKPMLRCEQKTLLGEEEVMDSL